MKMPHPVFVVLILTPIIWAQEKTTPIRRPTSQVAKPKPSNSTAKSTITIGTTELSLGMPRDAVLAGLAADFRLTKIDANSKSEGYLIVSQDTPVSTLGSVDFVDNKLWSVSKYWNPEDKNETVSFLKSLYALTEAIQKEQDTERIGFVVCALHQESTQTPDMEVQRIVFYCGPKELSVQIFTANGKKFANDVSIQETLTASQ